MQLLGDFGGHWVIFFPQKHPVTLLEKNFSGDRRDRYRPCPAPPSSRQAKKIWTKIGEFDIRTKAIRKIRDERV
jgi:hypothetical protein